MLEENKLVDWLDSENALQCTWLLKRLKNETKLQSSPDNYRKCLEEIETQESHLSDDDFKKLKKGWASYKSKYKDGNKPFNFIMSDGTYTQLSSLATALSVSQNKIVELLITKQYNKQLKKQEDIAKKQSTEEKYSLKNILSPLEYKELEQKINQQNTIIETLKNEKDTLTLRISELTVLLDSEKIKKLTDEQKTLAKKLHHKYK